MKQKGVPGCRWHGVVGFKIHGDIIRSCGSTLNGHANSEGMGELINLQQGEVFITKISDSTKVRAMPEKVDDVGFFAVAEWANALLPMLDFRLLAGSPDTEVRNKLNPLLLLGLEVISRLSVCVRINLPEAFDKRSRGACIGSTSTNDNVLCLAWSLSCW